MRRMKWFVRQTEGMWMQGNSLLVDSNLMPFCGRNEVRLVYSHFNRYTNGFAACSDLGMTKPLRVTVIIGFWTTLIPSSSSRTLLLSLFTYSLC